MSLVEQAIAKMRQAAGADAPVAARPEPVAAERAPPVAAARSRDAIPIDMDAIRAQGYLPEAAFDRPFAEHFRQIKRPLIERALSAAAQDGGPDPRVIMMTSGLSGEGKTFASINLAFSLARERDVSVLLVDADLPKPQVSAVFGVRQRPGLMDALVDEAQSVENLVVGTSVRGLSLLPAGRQGEGAAELLVSNRMQQLLKQLLAAHPRRIVLLDSPPILATSEGRALVKVAGQVVLIVRAGYSARAAVRDTIAQIGPDRIGGIVVNDAHLSLTENYYGYGNYASPGDGNDRNR